MTSTLRFHNFTTSDLFIDVAGDPETATGLSKMNESSSESESALSSWASCAGGSTWGKVSRGEQMKLFLGNGVGSVRRSSGRWRSARHPVVDLKVRWTADDSLEEETVTGGDVEMSRSSYSCFKTLPWRKVEGRRRVIRLSLLGETVGSSLKRSCLAFQWRDEDGEIHLSIYSQPDNLSTWMRALPDERLLESMYLPGSHESLALHGFPISSCQTFDLPHQFAMGIRVVDLRFSLKKGILVAYHGIQNQYLDAKDTFQQVYDFLEENPSESIVVSVKQENSVKGFELKMWELLSQREEMWFSENRWPSLGEVRGKAVMFCRFGFHSGKGIHARSWPDNLPAPWENEFGGVPVLVQDWYSIGSFLRIPEKAALVVSLFNRKSGGSDGDGRPDPLRINFMSGATLFTAFPFIVAKGFGAPSLLGFKGVNERVLESLVRLGREAKRDRGAIVLIDYYEVPGELVELMIAWNFLP
ncbi:PLC-like phosphodiesterase [Meredithblackwellia eburnea MCA 4105]